MADEPGIELEARITDIQESLSLWSQLPNHDKKQFKALVDQKIYALAHYARDKDTKKSKFLKRSLELHKTLWTAKFDLKSVEALISEEVERTMLEAGLQYEEYTRYRKFSIKNGFYKSAPQGLAYLKTENCYITYDSDARTYKVVNRDNKDVILTLPVDKADDPEYAESSNKVLIQNMSFRLEMSTIGEAQDFIEDFKGQTNRAFSAKPADYMEDLYSRNLYLR